MSANCLTFFVDIQIQSAAFLWESWYNQSRAWWRSCVVLSDFIISHEYQSHFNSFMGQKENLKYTEWTWRMQVYFKFGSTRITPNFFFFRYELGLNDMELCFLKAVIFVLRVLQLKSNIPSLKTFGHFLCFWNAVIKKDVVYNYYYLTKQCSSFHWCLSTTCW